MTFTPGEKKVEEVLAYLETAGDEERARVLEEEKLGKGRKSVLEPHGVTPDGPEVRRSGTGRILGPQEASPQDAVNVNIGAQIAEQREVIAESDAAPVEKSGPGAGGGGVTPAGTGAAPAAATPAAAAGAAAATGGSARAGVGAGLGTGAAGV